MCITVKLGGGDIHNNIYQLDKKVKNQHRSNPQFKYFSPNFLFSSAFSLIFFTALIALTFLTEIIASKEQSSASYASLFFPFQQLTAIVFLLYSWRVSMEITSSIFLPSFRKSLPDNDFVFIKICLPYQDDNNIVYDL